MKTVKPSVCCSVLIRAIEFARRDRVETRGGLIQEQKRRIERERPRQRHALGHAAGKFGREFVAVVCGQSHHFELGVGDLVQQRWRKMRGLAQRKLDVLPGVERREQRALLKQHAAAAGIVACRSGKVDLPAPLRQQPDQGPQQDRFAAAGRADQSQNLAFADIERKMVEHDAVAETDNEVLHVKWRCCGLPSSTSRSTRRTRRTGRRARSPGRST